MPRRETNMLICEIKQVESTGNACFVLADPLVYKTVRACKNEIRRRDLDAKRFAIIQLIEVVKVETVMKKKLVTEKILARPNNEMHENKEVPENADNLVSDHYESEPATPDQTDQTDATVEQAHKRKTSKKST